ncbi:hypothetical protein LSH36_201g04053 [Paralvinella palmiformis]|uniref:Uncharacterized protein n=1 Tax=Paralvinella palmiformis TaxID=53620 RepID=A0AAD9JPP6_9ANNE|nr:hypothetical protein LSH36_201g04053 [Paralvinella palmiformis]
MAHRDYPGVSCTFVTGMCFLLIGAAMMAVAFSSHHWIDSYVDREKLQRNGMDPKEMNLPIFYTRFRGLFFTCYPNDASFLDEPYYEEKVKDGRCLMEEGYEVPLRSTKTLEYTTYYDIHILFCAGAGTAIFHGLRYLESLIKYSNSQYGYSYMLVWLSLICCAVATILFSVRSYKLKFDDHATSTGKKRHQNHGYYHMNHDSPYPTVTYFEHSPYDFGGSYRY